MRPVLPLLLAAAAALPPAEPLPEPPRLALVLSGGGARGLAHIGALRALEEAGLAVDAIAASSMGAIVGGLYATGLGAAELERIVRSLDWGSIFDGRPDRRTLPVARHQDHYGTTLAIDFDWGGARLPGGLTAEHRVNRVLIEHLTPAAYAAGWDFDRLRIPFRCVAMDLESGERVVFSAGDLARAVRASMSIPVIFQPVEVEGRRLVDGGVVDNLPVGVAQALGARVVLAVDVTSEPLEPDDYRDALGVASQLTDILTQRANAAYAREPDVRVRPQLERHRGSDYSRIDELIERGYQATREAIPELRRALAAAGLPQTLAPRERAEPARRLDGTPIAEVVVEGNRRTHDSLVRRTFNIPLGPPFSIRRALPALDKVEATGLFSHVWMRPARVPEGLRVTLLVEEAPPNRVEIGAAFNEWEKARGSLRFKNLDSLGFGEETELLLAASEAETRASLSLRGDRLLVPGLGYRLSAHSFKDKPRFYDEEGVRLNRAEFVSTGFEARLQVPLERWGLVEAGLELASVETKPIAGLGLEEGTDRVRRLHGALTLDVLDRYLWPTAGFRVAGRVAWSPEGLGGSREHWKASGELRLGRPVGGRWHLQLEALGGVSGGDLALYDHYRLGGPRLVPGYHFEELKGPRVLASSLGVFVRALGPLRLFVRFGAGDVFEIREAIRLRDLRWGVAGGALYPSPIGPVAVEVGVRNGGDPLLTLAVGWN